MLFSSSSEEAFSLQKYTIYTCRSGIPRYQRPNGYTLERKILSPAACVFDGDSADAGVLGVIASSPVVTKSVAFKDRSEEVEVARFVVLFPGNAVAGADNDGMTGEIGDICNVNDSVVPVALTKLSKKNSCQC